MISRQTWFIIFIFITVIFYCLVSKNSSQVNQFSSWTRRYSTLCGPISSFCRELFLPSSQKQSLWCSFWLSYIHLLLGDYTNEVFFLHQKHQISPNHKQSQNTKKKYVKIYLLRTINLLIQQNYPLSFTILAKRSLTGSLQSTLLWIQWG